MARKFVKLTKQRLGRLQVGERLSEHGIEYERLPNGDGVFRINVMVDGQRVHRTLGRASEAMTPQQAWEWRANCGSKRRRIVVASPKVARPKWRLRKRRVAT